MITFKEYLAEHYVTTDNPEEKQKHLQHAHDMIRASYKSIGGYSGLGHGSEKESEAILWLDDKRIQLNTVENPDQLSKALHSPPSFFPENKKT